MPYQTHGLSSTLYKSLCGLGGGGAASTNVYRWPMSDGSGTTVTEIINGNNLTITPGTGSWGTQAGVTNGIYNFDGTTTRMDAGSNSLANFNFNQAFSVWAVFNATNTGSEQTVIGTLNTSSNFVGWEMGLSFVSSVLLNPVFFLINTFPTNCIEVVTSSASVVPGTLYDLAMTYSGSGAASGVIIYINGAAQTNSVLQNNLTTTTTNSINPRVGMRQDSSVPFKGKMGPIGIWNRVLSSTEVTTLHGNFYATIS